MKRHYICSMHTHLNSEQKIFKCFYFRDVYTNKWTDFDVLLTVHLSIVISVINQLDAQNFCFTISLFHASTCFEHMCSKHVEAWNKLIVKQKFCSSSWLITEINKWTDSETPPPKKSIHFSWNFNMRELSLLLLLLLLSSSSSSYPLCRVFILIFLRQTMSLGNTVLQLFCCYYSRCLYR